MICICQICEQRIIEGQEVYLMVCAPFKELASKIHFAVGQPTWADPETLAHRECYEIEQRAFNEPGER